MTRIKRHECSLTESLIKKIEYVLPKLKYSVYINLVRTWLENFEETEVDLALDFLFYIEYITFGELQSRLHEQLNKVIIGTANNILLVPYAPYPKSNDVILYLLTKLDVFKANKNRISYTKDLTSYNLSKETTLVFVDDFIGTGKSFDKWYTRKKIDEYINKHPLISKEQIILAAVILLEGQSFLNSKFKGIKIHAELRNKVFSTEHSPFNLTDSRVQMKDVCMKYGKSIQVGFDQKTKKNIYQPLGYDNSEALIVFDYGTPNNTLSIIWGEKDWVPIFPRMSKGRINNAKQIKQEAEFYLGVMNKIGFEMGEDFEIVVGKKKVFYNRKTDYSLLAVVLLKEKKYHDIMICQLLGITMAELSVIFRNCKKKKLLDRENQLTRLGIKYLETLKAQGKKFKFRENVPVDLEKEVIFIPNSFEGKT